MKQRIIRVAVSETDYQKILRKKEEDNFEDRNFGEWLAWIAHDVKNSFDYRDEIGKSTARGLLKMWCQNFAQNLPFILEEAAILEIVPKDLSKIPIGPCLPPGQLINTANGLTSIQNVKVGDWVLTHKGRYRKVTKVLSRHFNGNLIQIITNCGKNIFFSTTTTPEHPYLARRLKHVTKNRKEIRQFLKLRWVPANEIEIRKTENRYQQYLCLPIITEMKDKKFYKFTIPWTRNRKAKMFNLPLNQYMMRIIGYYLAEGSLLSYDRRRSKNYLDGIQFSFGFNEKEYEYANEVCGLLEKLGFRGRIIKSKYGYAVRVYSRVLAEFLIKQFGQGSHFKHLPLWIKMLPKKKLTALLESYINGDGTRKCRIRSDKKKGIRYKINEQKFGSVSLQLAIDMRDVASKLGYNCFITRYEPKKNRIGELIVNTGVNYAVGISSRKNGSRKWDKRYQYLNPKRIERIPYNGLVFNLEVEEDNSYCTMMHALHNCIVVGAGPSIYEHKHLELLSKYIHDGRYKGIVVATDRMLVPCLDLGIVPHISVTVDGSPIIQKFFDHPKVVEYGPQLKIVLTCTTSPLVAETCRKNNCNIYWYNPMFDDVRRNESFSRMQKFTTMSDRHPNGLANVSAGGNAGCAGWVFSHSLLRRSPIALIGLDFGFPEGTPLKETPYYSGMINNVGGDTVIAARYGFEHFIHPIFKTKSYADPVFCNYRASFRETVSKAPSYVQTYNCTEGGTLWGEKITCIPFQEFLDKVAYE